MSILGFRASNHPQQVAKRGASDAVDERITPQWLFDALNEKHRFTLDAAASASNHQCVKYFDLKTDGLTQNWSGYRVWCNPPYSRLNLWTEKAVQEANTGVLIVMLLPANRTEQSWWQDLIEPKRDKPDQFITTRFLRSRINFGRPGNESAKYHSSAPFGLVLVTFNGTKVAR